MRRSLALLGVFLALVVVGTTPAPRPAAPVIVLHRTASAKFFDPGKRSPLFVLVIGSDVREGDPKRGRSDSLHLIALNPVSGHGTIVGIPRDSYVPIPGRGVSKINSSLTAGGPQRTVETVSKLSGIPIQYWAIIEFSRFRNLVDAVGGVVADIPYHMEDKFSGAFFEPGKRRLDGGQALAFSRARHGVPGGDFGRSLNQGRLLLSALSQFRQDAYSTVKLARYLAAFHSLVETNVPMRELLTLASIARHVDPHRVENLVLPGHGGSAGGASVVFLDPSINTIFNQIRDDGVR